jgi:hypothetical protein
MLIIKLKQYKMHVKPETSLSLNLLNITPQGVFGMYLYVSPDLSLRLGGKPILLGGTGWELRVLCFLLEPHYQLVLL